MSEAILRKLDLPAFSPLPGINSGRAQTIAAAYLPFNPIIINTQHHIIDLADGDKIVIAENHPTNVSPNHRIIVMIHGLTGSYQSPYMVRLTKAFLRLGYSVIRMNIRGCGPGQHLAQFPYHSGLSHDVAEVIKWLSVQYPSRLVTLMGFSLGANHALKLAGEHANTQIGNLDSLVAVSPPLDLHASSVGLISEDKRPFNDYFVEKLISDAKLRHEKFPHLPALPDFPSPLTFREFDELYTAPICGFKDAKDYYNQCSTSQFIDRIKLPLFILHADDDPVVDNNAFRNLPKTSNLDALITPQGGHLGWIGYSGDLTQFGYHWMDHAVVKWVKWHEDRNKLQ